MRLLSLSKDLNNPRWKPLHMARGWNSRNRRLAKQRSKNNWYKGKTEVEPPSSIQEEGKAGKFTFKQEDSSIHEEEQTIPEEEQPKPGKLAEGGEQTGHYPSVSHCQEIWSCKDKGPQQRDINPGWSKEAGKCFEEKTEEEFEQKAGPSWGNRRMEKFGQEEGTFTTN